jgi:hypothetical protein
MSYKRKTLRPSEIAKRGLITNSLNSTSYASNYQFILSEIKAGRLKAREYGTKSRPYYTVSEAEIKRYQLATNN